MGNGRRLGIGSENVLGRFRVFAALLILLVAAAILLAPGSHRFVQDAKAQLPASPFQSSPGSVSAPNTPNAHPDARAILGALPLIFEPNAGQADASVKFVSHGAGYGLFFDAEGAVLGMRTSASQQKKQQRWLRMKLVDENHSAAIMGENPLPGKSNYLIGNDPNHWRRGIPQFGRVEYKNVYPGIDLVFYGNQGRLEYDFRVAPGANPGRAELQFDGATKLKLSGGDLILTGADEGAVHLHAPAIYQPDGARRIPVSGRFILRSRNRIGFEIGPYDRGRELVIDPLLTFSSYFGGTGPGSGNETFPAVAVNGDGNIYLAGSDTSSAGFPVAGSTITNSPGTDVFLAKITPSLPPVIVYLTFLGGSGTDTNIGLAVDTGGNPYIVGNTTSTNFPTIGNSYQSAPETKGSQCASITCTSIYVSVLDSLGATLTYSSYISGNGDDIASGMAIDTNRDVYLTGTTTSDNEPSTDEFPATQVPQPQPYQSTPASSLQFFATKVNTILPGKDSIAYSTYFGGASPTGAIAVGGGMAVDTTGNMYFSGTTNFYNSGTGNYGNSGPSGDFPILNAYQPCLDTPPPVVLPVSSPCTAPSTTPFPTDAFLAKINPNGLVGSQLLFSTFLGGTATDSSTSVTIDSGAANIYLTGSTNSTDFVLPVGEAAYQGCLNTPGVVVTTTASCPATTTNTDAYVARFANPAVSTNGTPIDVGLAYFSYLGGSGNDAGLSIAVDTASDGLVTGSTNSTNFPVTAGPIQSTLNGTQNAFFARIDTKTITGQTGFGSYVTYFGGNGVDRGTSIGIDPVSLYTFLAGDTTSTNLQQVNAVSLSAPPASGQTEDFVAELQSVPSVCITCVAPVVSPIGIEPAGVPVQITFTVNNDGLDVATGIGISGAVSSSAVTFVSASTAGGTCSAPSDNGVVCTIPALQPSSTTTVVFQVTPSTVGNFEATATVFMVNNTNTDVVGTASFSSSDYSVTVSPAGQSVAAGGIADYAVQVSPAEVFAGTVSLTCSSLPTGATCHFANSSLTFNGNNTATTLSVLTTAQPATVVDASPWRHGFYAFGLMVPGIAIWGLGGARKTCLRRVLGRFAVFLFLALALFLPSCSHKNTTPPVPSGTPSGTYSLTVTATSGSFSRSAPFQLTVNP
jgi:Beta-propeller repeat